MTLARALFGVFRPHSERNGLPRGSKQNQTDSKNKNSKLKIIRFPNVVRPLSSKSSRRLEGVVMVGGHEVRGIGSVRDSRWVGALTISHLFLSATVQHVRLRLYFVQSVS